MVCSLNVKATVSKEILEEYELSLNEMSLEQLVKEFVSYLDYTEETDSGIEFHPISISSCRVLMTQPLNSCLRSLRERIKYV